MHMIMYVAEQLIYMVRSFELISTLYSQYKYIKLEKIYLIILLINHFADHLFCFFTYPPLPARFSFESQIFGMSKC